MRIVRRQSGPVMAGGENGGNFATPSAWGASLEFQLGSLVIKKSGEAAIESRPEPAASRGNFPAFPGVSYDRERLGLIASPGDPRST